MHKITVKETSPSSLWADFPRLGWNADAYVFSFNMFTFPSSSASFRHLQVLSLAYADKVGDAGLVHLRKLTRLRTLALYNTGVTVAGVRVLRRALPQAQIEH